MTIIRNLKGVGRNDVPTVGGKAAALGELLKAGFKVPEGIVLTTDAYSLIVQGMRTRIDARVTADAINDPAEIENLAAEVRKWFDLEAWPPALQANLEEAVEACTPLRDSPSFAARTSLPSDELATAFGSGVQRASLGLIGIEGIKHGTAQCWGALWTSRSMYYRHRKGVPQTQVSLAVLVQPMVRADAAGTLFTENPLTAEQDEMEIEAIWGLGAPLTQARMTPDRYLVSKRAQSITARQTADKPVRLGVSESGDLEQQVVPPLDSSSPSLTDRQVLALAELAAQVEGFFGGPQKIEWALVGDLFYILQARPSAARAS